LRLRGADGGSQVGSSDTDAGGCDRTIRAGPLGERRRARRRGTVLCVLSTDEQRKRMVLVEIIDVAADGTAGLRATWWTVP
jgi:hypothetical protein